MPYLSFKVQMLLLFSMPNYVYLSQVLFIFVIFSLLHLIFPDIFSFYFVVAVIVKANYNNNLTEEKTLDRKTLFVVYFGNISYIPVYNHTTLSIL